MSELRKLKIGRSSFLDILNNNPVRGGSKSAHEATLMIICQLINDFDCFDDVKHYTHPDSPLYRYILSQVINAQFGALNQAKNDIQILISSLSS